ncbi:MAG: hypothetical protein K6A23_12020, partial [Butyrivibrio sp.]|nr:hypothetical protein [Butyrivibrio sp.]
DTKRNNGITVNEYYTSDVPKELIYQALFENTHLATVNEDNIAFFNSDDNRKSMEKYYLLWAIENGLEDICSEYSYKERNNVNGFQSKTYYYAVIDGEVTKETEEIYADSGGNLSYSSFYKVLVRQGFPVEGNWYHYSFTGIDAKKYEFGYDQCILEADPRSSQDESNSNYSRTNNNFYYFYDGEKYNMGNEPIIKTEKIEDMTGIKVTSTYENN